MAEQPNDGGPAFPLGEDDRSYRADGMTLRDYFAAKAMQGLYANPGGAVQANGMTGWGLVNCTPQNVADLSYQIADAMLAARGAE